MRCSLTFVPMVDYFNCVYSLRKGIIKMKKLTLKQLKTAGSVIEKNSKIPASNWSIPASICKTGGKLREIEGTPCNSCYALRIEKRWKSAGKAWADNYDLFLKHLREKKLDQWAVYMAEQINRIYKKTGRPYHRWFVSGDLQSVTMLDTIKRVCELTPNINHWLPTQERNIVKNSKTPTPDNLVIRISASKIDGRLPDYPYTSGVNREKDNVVSGAVECNAYKNNGECGDCRACWSKDVPSISYPLH